MDEKVTISLTLLALFSFLLLLPFLVLHILLVAIIEVRKQSRYLRRMASKAFNEGDGYGIVLELTRSSLFSCKFTFFIASTIGHWKALCFPTQGSHIRYILYMVLHTSSTLTIFQNSTFQTFHIPLIPRIQPTSRLSLTYL